MVSGEMGMGGRGNEVDDENFHLVLSVARFVSLSHTHAHTLLLAPNNV